MEEERSGFSFVGVDGMRWDGVGMGKGGSILVIILGTLELCLFELTSMSLLQFFCWMRLGTPSDFVVYCICWLRVASVSNCYCIITLAWICVVC